MYRYIWKIKLFDPAQEKAFLDHWRANSQILQQYPGALGSHAHRLRDEPGCLLLTADWRSQADRDAMSDDIHNGDSDLAVQWRKLTKSSSFGDITIWAGEEIGSVSPSDVKSSKD